MEKENLKRLFLDNFDREAERMRELSPGGSHRRYYRMEGGGHECLGVCSPDPLETRAFLAFTRHFGKLGLNVPRLISTEEEKGIYLLQDLGDLTLKDAVEKSRREGNFPGSILSFYKTALEHLVRFQLEGHGGLDYSVCVPSPDFDRQSLMWDLNHFKYLFLKLTGIPFDEEKLEKDFLSLADFLSGADSDHFMYRDFQSRNIMIHKNELYFVDYQGGRRGALQYDVASLLFESRIDLDPVLRGELLSHYLESLEKHGGSRPQDFEEHYYGFVLIRILQAMGAYGIRGMVEKKPLFLQSIPFAIRNLQWLMGQSLLPKGLPELKSCLERLAEWNERQFREESGELTLRIYSFSYNKGMPVDLRGHGGGFVFDCRALPNPGREEKYSLLNGQDPEVREFLEQKREVREFLEHACSLVLSSLEEYRSRNFNELMVSFGCTGGQHRSVYCAERLRDLVQGEMTVKTRVVHRDLERL